MVKRFDVYLVALDPTLGRVITRTRPCVVISPDEMNEFISTIIIAPMTTRGQDFPTRIPCDFQKKKGQIVLDQIRTVDKVRLVRKLGRIEEKLGQRVLSLLLEMFSP